MTQSRTWPPLIHAALPAWMKWRDAVLTLLMWSVFAYLVQRQIRLIESTYQDRANLEEFVLRLAPYTQLALILILLLLGAAAFTQRRRRRSFQLPEPPPLALADEARRAGLDQAALTAARGLRIALVHVNGAGRFRIFTPSSAPESDRSGSRDAPGSGPPP